MGATTFESEIRAGERYGFGENWLRFSELIGETRVEGSKVALREALQLADLEGKTFLDIGSGSGLSSLAARRLGAKVTSFDYDSESVRCTQLLRGKFAPEDRAWQVLQGSVLDVAFMSQLESADAVYSWGVLHHTGRMFDAVRAAAQKVRPGGLFCVALYRRTALCGFWKVEKRFYSKAPQAVRRAVQAAWIAKTRLAFALKGRDFGQMVQEYGVAPQSRGMDYYRDVDDWLGGYPYESITPAECRAHVSSLGFELVREKILGEGISWATSSGCDEWLFRRNP
jgi:SAM-dependent methyltransferase